MPALASIARAGLIAFLVALGAFAGMTASAALTSSDPDLQIQGDVDCDEDVDTDDALDVLIVAANLDPATQHEPCTNIESAIPAVEGPQGPPGEPGPPGPPGEPAVTHFANVADDGTFLGGDATTVERTEEGVYRVRFPTDVSGCAATANAGSMAGSGSFHQLGIVTTFVGSPTDRDVGVQINQPIAPYEFPYNDLVDSGFHLIVAC